MKLDHNIPVGPIHSCQVCHSEKLKLVIDLGHQPLCDSLLSSEQLNEPENTYPLRLLRCLNCSCAQIDYVVPGEIVFHRNYPYRSGITKEVVDHHDQSSNKIIQDYNLSSDSLVIDIGSNDGTLLNSFKKRGIRVLGIEPTNIAHIAIKNGIETIQKFFTESLAREIIQNFGQASVLTATNVFAHIAALGEVMRGAAHVLKKDGVFMTESHYLLDIIRDVQFDTIYHEHLRSYSLKSLIHLFNLYDFTVVDAERVDRYGGSLRVFAMKGENRSASASVSALLSEEKAFGLYKDEVYKNFYEKTILSKNKLLKLALHASSKGLRLAGNSCPGRCSTLINFAGIRKDLMPYIAEQPTSLKLGLFLPGMHIPIVKNDILFKEQPDYVVLLAWHYWKPIMENLKQRGLKSKFAIPLPELRIL